MKKSYSILMLIIPLLFLLACPKNINDMDKVQKNAETIRIGAQVLTELIVLWYPEGLPELEIVRDEGKRYAEGNITIQKISQTINDSFLKLDWQFNLIEDKAIRDSLMIGLATLETFVVLYIDFDNEIPEEYQIYIGSISAGIDGGL